MSRSKGWFTVSKVDLQKPLNLFEVELKAAKLEDITTELKNRGFSIQLKLNNNDSDGGSDEIGSNRSNNNNDEDSKYVYNLKLFQYLYFDFYE